MRALTHSRSLLAATVLLVAAAIYVNLFLHRAEARAPRASLDTFPAGFGTWSGTDQKFPTDILVNLGVDEYLMRRFSDGKSTIWLYIG